MIKNRKERAQSLPFRVIEKKAVILSEQKRMKPGRRKNEKKAIDH